MLLRSAYTAFLIVLMAFSISGCAKPGAEELTGPAPLGPNAPPNSMTGIAHTEVLLFAGESAWQAEVESIEYLLYNHGVTYQQVTSAQLELLSLDELASFKLLVFPGGDALAITQSLSANTHAKLRTAVQDRGLSYIGFCAGAWLAFAPAPPPGRDVTYGFGIANGPILENNYLYHQGEAFALSRASFPNGTQRDLLWYGGPITPKILGGVIAKYPDGTPAVTQLKSGKGFVIVSGLHPTANVFILSSLGFESPEAIAPDFAWELFHAALEKTPLPAF